MSTPSQALVKAPKQRQKKRARAAPEFDKVFLFEELAPELREMVYDNLLFFENICVRWVKKKDGHRFFHGPKATAPGRKVPLLGENGASILRLNKFIRKEAMQSLYGKPVFKFTSHQAIRPFLKTIGNSITSLRYVEIPTLPTAGLSLDMRALRAATDLRGLKISLWDRDSRRIDWLALRFSSLFPAGSSQAEDDALLEKISFVAAGRWDSPIQDHTCVKMKEVLGKVVSHQ